VLMVAQTGLFGPTSAPVGLAMAKTSLTFSQAFFRGVLCNFLVCIAIVQASSAQDFAGKAVRAPRPVAPSWRQWGAVVAESSAARSQGSR
jgi:formate/nitrite transporter FocA (FNT family)